MPQRFKITIAYDGRSYKGWQIQPNGVSVQEKIQEALRNIAGEVIPLHASGRTDTGVHALAQVAHFDVPAECRLSANNWPAALNTKLPSSIRILSAEAVSDDFHARFSAIEKTYRYEILQREIHCPFSAGLAWHIRQTLDADVLRSHVSQFIGEHDFRHFAALRGNEKTDTNYRRQIHRAEVIQEADKLVIEFTGNGFLYKMVRLMVGAAVHQTEGRLPENQIRRLLNEPTQPHKKPYCAPPDGLFLKKVSYAER